VRVLQIVLVGAAAGIVCGVLTLMIELAVLLMRAAAEQGGGSAGLGAVSMGSWAPITTLVGFLLGALWQYRRSS
jgi:hypothetical protein